MIDTLTKETLAKFTGSEIWYRHNLVRTALYTQGVRYVAEKAQAYWLVDDIFCNQRRAEIANEEFQLWTLRTELANSKALLTCEDGNGRVVYSTPIYYTDFPLDEIRFYYTNNVLMLPSEY